MGFGVEPIGTDAGQAQRLQRRCIPLTRCCTAPAATACSASRNLDLLPPTGALVIAAPLKIARRLRQPAACAGRVLNAYNLGRAPQ